MNNFKLHVLLNEYYVDRISVGLQGNITSLGEQFPMLVSRVVPEIRNRNFEVDLVFTDGQPENLRVGKSYRVQIELGQSEQAIIIPNGDFHTATNGKWIYKIIDGGRAIKSPIVLGRKNPNQFEVISGLQPGDQIIVNGYDQFNNKDEIILQ